MIGRVKNVEEDELVATTMPMNPEITENPVFAALQWGHAATACN
jgi:hypothetical protein